MLFKIGNEIVNTETTPVGLIFKTKEEAKRVGNILSNIKDGDTQLPVDGNGNWWFMMPIGKTKQEKDDWSVLTDEQKILLDNKAEITHVLDFEL